MHTYTQGVNAFLVYYSVFGKGILMFTVSVSNVTSILIIIINQNTLQVTFVKKQYSPKVFSPKRNEYLYQFGTGHSLNLIFTKYVVIVRDLFTQFDQDTYLHTQNIDLSGNCITVYLIINYACVQDAQCSVIYVIMVA